VRIIHAGSEPHHPAGTAGVRPAELTGAV
jgi:hypothetical protein